MRFVLVDRSGLMITILVQVASHLIFTRIFTLFNEFQKNILTY